MILLVPEVHPVNLPLFLLLSLRHTVRAYTLQPFLYRFKGGIQMLDLARYVDREESILIKSGAVRAWEQVVCDFPESRWEVDIKRRRVDFSLKAKQVLLSEMERLAFLKFISETRQAPDTAIVDSLKASYLAGLDKKRVFFNYRAAGTASHINKFLDRVYFALVNAGYFAKVLGQYIYAFIYNNRIRHAVDYIYDGISPRELSPDRGKITFSWIIDGKLIPKDSILFLMPRADFQMRDHRTEYCRDKALLAVARDNMLTVTSRKRLLNGLREVFCVFFRYYRRSTVDLEGACCLKYTMSVMKWLPLLEDLKPKVYLASVSSISAEEPAISYFNAIGMKTIMWLYSFNVGHFLTKQKNCDFREAIFSNMISSALLVWDRNYKEALMAHPQARSLEVRVIGPLMCGDENVMKLDKKTLCKSIGVSYNPTLRYVSVFDTLPINPRYMGPYVRYPEYNTAEYHHAFVLDLYRLVSDFPNIFLIYKPKRSLDSGKFIYMRQARDIIEKIKEEGKGRIVDHNINPWLPIALADICVSMPFESPTAAALSHNKPALFHDPTNIVTHHPYTHLSKLISHDYGELKEKISRILSDGNFNNACGRNFSDEFRDYLRGEAKQRARIYV